MVGFIGAVLSWVVNVSGGPGWVTIGWRRRWGKIVYFPLHQKIVEIFGGRLVDEMPDVPDQIRSGGRFTVVDQPESEQTLQAFITFVSVRHHPHHTLKDHSERAGTVFNGN